MARLKVVAQKRKILGRKVKQLRREGILPANLFGKKIKSQALQVNQKELLEVFEKIGETGLIDLVVGKQKARPVLISSFQLNPITDDPLHVDFHQVNLEEKTLVAVPVELIGSSPVVEKDEGTLVQPLLEVTVEALPQKLPDHLEADISTLVKLNDAVRISDLKVGKGVEIKAEKNEIVVKVSALREEEEVAPAPSEEEAGVEEKVEGEEGKETEGKTEGKEEEEVKKEGKTETQNSSK